MEDPVIRQSVNETNERYDDEILFWGGSSSKREELTNKVGGIEKEKGQLKVKSGE